MHEEFAASLRAAREEDARTRILTPSLSERLSSQTQDASEFHLWAGTRASDADAPRVSAAVRRLSEALAPLSSYVLSRFAARLGAFAESSPDYLRRNFLECRAEVELFAGRVSVRFLTCPLQMVLRMAGYDQASPAVPWLKNRKLEFHFD